MQGIVQRFYKMFARKISNDIDSWQDSLKIKKRGLIIRGLRQIKQRL